MCLVSSGLEDSTNAPKVSDGIVQYMYNKEVSANNYCSRRYLWFQWRHVALHKWGFLMYLAFFKMLELSIITDIYMIRIAAQIIVKFLNALKSQDLYSPRPWRHLQKTDCSVFRSDKLLRISMDCNQNRREKVKIGIAAGRKHATSSGDVSYHPSKESEKGTECLHKSCAKAL